MQRQLYRAIGAIGLTWAAQAGAAVPDAEWEQFKAKFAEMEARVKALEAENARLRQGSTVPVEDLSVLKADVATLKEQNASTDWAETIGVAGDFRYRYETIDVENRDDRERNRIRARVALTAELPSDVEVGFGLSTGGDDPVSGNQTLGNGNSTKDIALDKAYFKWNATDSLAILAGKYSNPLYRPQKNGLLWDGDWRPEGVSAQWNSGALFANFLGNWLESDSGGDNDAFAWGLQGGARMALGDASLTAALAYFDFPTKGSTPFYEDDFFGNSSVDGTYLYDYQLVEASAELLLAVADMPLSVYGDFVQNQDADDNDIGWQAGVVLGKVSGWGSWSLAYAYQDLEADAVLGLLSDSDFAGGGTDGKGHRIGGSMGLTKQWSLGFTWYVDNEAGEVNLADEGGALSYDRFIIDTMFKY
ncbi:hypothetical protein E4634_04230 [Mangrovimicrobium sediminis]|uniref:Porin n=1 Tax=Mangrovimicrobium sediminis TaxID=2562682 RepID=A0A4Z0M6T2_9GAMM|nr:putative porin [Haliea sp. SAOS-164]TGD75214.1 hypothetical protein E4634_04230 [Haliea sp. SAOS-164]